MAEQIRNNSPDFLWHCSMHSLFLVNVFGCTSRFHFVPPAGLNNLEGGGATGAAEFNINGGRFALSARGQ
jgi:hypothetical protein